MPHVTPLDVHVNRALTNFSVGYVQDQKNYVAAEWAPIIPVSKQSDLYFKYDKGDMLRNVAEVRAPGTESAGSGVRISTAGPYYCNIVAIHDDLDMDTVANADEPLNPKRDSTQNVVQWLMTKLEYDFAAAQFKAGVWTTDWTGTSGSTDYDSKVFKYWSSADADPITDIEKACEVIQGLIGRDANKMIMTRDVFTIIKNHPKVIDRIKYTQRGVVPAGDAGVQGILADLLGIEKVIVAKAIYNSAKELATDSISRIMSNGILLGYVNPTPSIRQPSASYTMVWNDLFGQPKDVVPGMGMRMMDYPLIWKKVHRIEGEMPYDQKVICTDCGLFMDKVLHA